MITTTTPKRRLCPQIVPHSVEAGMGLLGSILQHPAIFGEVLQEIAAKHFYVPAHQVIFGELCSLFSKGQSWDLITFTNHLRDQSLLEQIGGASYLTTLLSFVPSPANFRYYVTILKEKATLRKIITQCTDAIKRAQVHEGDAEEILAAVQNELMSIGPSADSRRILGMKDLARQTLEEIKELCKKKMIPGLHTGLIDLDKKLGGLQPGDLVIIGGRASDGKTSLGLNIVENVSASAPCGIISLEMNAIDLTKRLIGANAKISLHAMVTGNSNQSDIDQISRATVRVNDLPIYIRDEADVDPLKMRAIGRQMKAQYAIKLLMVDYIQLLTPLNAKETNRERIVADFAHCLKHMAKELGIVVLALSQLNDDGRLRESRAIEHAADKIILIEHNEGDPGQSKLRVQKNRNGPAGAVQVAWLSHCTRFDNLARGVRTVTPSA